MLLPVSPNQIRPLASRRFNACEASALARLIFRAWSGGPPTLRRRKTSPFRTYSAPVMGSPTQNASSPKLTTGFGGSFFFLPGLPLTCGWNCCCQYCRGPERLVSVSIGMPTATLTELVYSGVLYKHCVNRNDPPGCSLGSFCSGA